MVQRPPRPVVAGTVNDRGRDGGACEHGYHPPAVKRTLERELKLDVEPGFILPDLGGRPIEPRSFTSTYYDTPARRLLGCGITLRRRVENRAGVWQLKLPSEDGRFELEQPGGPTRVPSFLLDLLPALLRGGATLEPVAKLRTQRAGYAVTRGTETVEVALDSVTVLDGTRVAGRFAELEAESVAGDGPALTAIGKELRRAGAKSWDGIPKLARILAADGAPVAAAGHDTPLARVRALLARQYREVLANDPGVRLGADPEALHQARVGTRRARALLRAAHALIDPAWAERLRAELKWLGGLLGPVRDLDVLLDHLDADSAVLENADARAFRRIRKRLATQRDEARAALLEGTDSGRYFELLDLLEGAADAPGSGQVVALDAIAARAFDRLRKTARKLPKRPSDDELHQVRIATKRARYAAELAEPVLKKPGSRFIECAKVLQDVIGEHQDACVAEERIRALAQRGGGATGVAAGRLIERQRRRKQAARRAYRDAWRRLEQAGRKAFRS
jgi:CHAD domain-containing protein